MPSVTTEFDIDDFASTRRPILQASMPPPYFFTSGEVFRREVAQIFSKEWLCVGRVEQVALPGDYFTVDVAGEPVTVVRDNAGQINALSPVCRHKSAHVASGEGNCRAFTCPYHGWTYSLSGTLISARGMDSAENFDKALYRLPSFKLEVWNKFIFINFDFNARPLAPDLEELACRLNNYGLAELECPEREYYEFACNWKVWIDNAGEAYHVDLVHEATALPDYPSRIFHTEVPHGRYEVLKALPQTPHSATKLHATQLPTIESLAEIELKEFKSILVYPNLFLSTHPTGINYSYVLPDGPNRCKLSGGLCFPNSTLEAPNFETVSKIQYARWANLREEDIGVVESSQRGYQSRFSSKGRYSDQEQIPYRFHNYVIDKIM